MKALKTLLKARHCQAKCLCQRVTARTAGTAVHLVRIIAQLIKKKKRKKKQYCDDRLRKWSCEGEEISKKNLESVASCLRHIKSLTRFELGSPIFAFLFIDEDLHESFL